MMGRTGNKLEELEQRIIELESKVARLMNDLRVRNQNQDFVDSEGLSQT